MRTENEAVAKEPFTKISKEAKIQVDMQSIFLGDLFGRLINSVLSG